MDDANSNACKAFSLMKQYSKYWEAEIAGKGYDSIILKAVEDYSEDLEAAGEPLFALVTTGPEYELVSDPRKGEYHHRFVTNSYDFVIVTERALLNHQGSLDDPSLDEEYEPDVLIPRREIARIATTTRKGASVPGGEVASHATFNLRLANGDEFALPGSEGFLNDDGIRALENVVLSIREELFA